MIPKKLKEINSRFSRKEKLFLLFSVLANILIAFDYAIVRPVSQSFFLSTYGSSALPYAWLCTLPVSLGVVFLYNHFLPKLGCFPLFCITTTVVSCGNFFGGAFIDKIPSVSFAFYIWKEVYILLMLQQLWSVIHATIDLKEAKYLYGVLFGLGALGAALGSLVPGYLAVQMGSSNLLFFTLPVYAVLTAAYFLLLRYSGTEEKVEGKKTKEYASLSKGFSLIFSSKLLFAILLMTAFMQITATVTTFQFQSLLEGAYPSVDLRTQFAGRLFLLGNMVTMSLQFFGAFFLIRYLGMQKTHFFVPFILSLSSFLFLSFPSFGPIACSFVLIKAFDFSLFGVVKEMLYIPMRLEEKFQAKAIIDVFAYRASKVIASLFIVCLQAFFPLYLLTSLSYVNFAFFIIWCFLIIFLRSSYKQAEQFSLKDRAPT
jgi:ATP:ADP antiporter, AAA family